LAVKGRRLTLSEAMPSAEELLAGLHTTLIVINRSGLIVRANAAAEVLLNESASHLIGCRLVDVVKVPEAYLPIDGSVLAAFDVDIATRKGGRFRGDYHANPLSDYSGWYIISMNPVAGVQHRNQQLERRRGARTAIGIAAMLAHEIKNPLSGIRGAAQLLDQHVSAEDAVMTKLIRTEVDRIAALIDQMQGFTDTRAIDFTADNIHQMIDHARNVAQSGFGAQIEIVEIYDPSLPMVRVHRDSMIQILLNLLKNAAETVEGDEQRIIKLTTRYRHGVSVATNDGTNRLVLPIELCVIDDGPGVPAELAENLFEPFISSKRGGRGLGLALVDKLVRDMGGIIQYAREGRPEMTVFRILLPRADMAAL
jgi:two-component system, NtrC family, nitrogen regulation sensor histidine kinase GlnL